MDKALLIVEVDFPEAKEFADLSSLLQDFGGCIATCDRLIDLLNQSESDAVFIESLWTAALIRYARCFSSGRRYGLSEAFLSELEGDPIGTHRFFVSMRDKHIAHSVNPFEQVKIGLVLDDPTVEKRVIGVLNLHQRHVSAKSDGVETLKRLCQVIQRKLAEDWKKAREVTLAVGQELDVESLYARSQVQTVAPGPTDSGKARA